MAVTVFAAPPKAPERSDRVQLLEQVKGIYLGMHVTDLLAARPEASLGDSTKAYSEDFAENFPFVSAAVYSISMERLSRVDLYRGFTLEGFSELDRLIPGLLSGARDLWGEPTDVGVFLYPRVKGKNDREVLIRWVRSGMTIMLDYTPQATNQEKSRRGDREQSRICISFLYEDEAEVRYRDFTVSHDAQQIRPYFSGFPTKVAPGTPILR